MLKTVKSKVIAGAVTVGLLSGGGVVLGATDAGAQLKDWYDAKFSTASTNVVTDSYNYANSLVPGLTAEYQGFKDNTSNKLKAKGEFDTGVTNEAIDKKSQEYIDQINGQKAHIESYLSSQFDNLSSAAKGLIDQSGKEALKYANDDLASHANAEGQKAIADVNVKVKGATAEAARKLQETIDGAKSSLQGQLDTKQAATTAEIKAMIDTEISRLRTIITSTNNQLIIKQEKLITMTAKGLLIAGQAELDGIVGNINK